MPQTGYTPIQIYSSSTPTNAPSAGNLTNDTKGSELAINIADKNLFFKDSTNAVNTVPIRQSGAASDGWLSSTDWNTFNNKQPAGAYLTSVTADAPLSGAGTSASHLVIAQATTSTSGYLSSTDWNTFNSKQAALVSGTNIKTVNGTTLLGSGDLGTIAIGYGGTGKTSFTSNQVIYGSMLQSSNLQFDGTNLGVGATPSAWGGTSVAIQTPAGSIESRSNGLTLTNNTYFDGTNWKYTNSLVASLYALGSDGGFQWYRAASGTAGNNISFTQAMTLDPNGDLALGTSSPYNPVGSSMTAATINGSTYGVLYLQANSGAVRFALGATTANNTVAVTALTNHPMTFATNDTERMRIFASGGVSIGNTTDPGATNLSVNGAVYIGQASSPGGVVLDVKTAGEVSILNRNTAGDGVILRYQKQGSTVGYISTNTYSLPSDERVKKNIVPISLGLSFLLDLEPVEYNTIFQDPENESRKNFGLKAQQVEATLQKHGKTVNDVTFLEKFDEYKEGESQYGLGYQNLVPVLIKAVYELQAQIDELKGTKNVAN